MENLDLEDLVSQEHLLMRRLVDIGPLDPPYGQTGRCGAFRSSVSTARTTSVQLIP
jgi:hypothetical protein